MDILNKNFLIFNKNSFIWQLFNFCCQISDCLLNMSDFFIFQPIEESEIHERFLKYIGPLVVWYFLQHFAKNLNLFKESSFLKFVNPRIDGNPWSYYQWLYVWFSWEPKTWTNILKNKYTLFANIYCFLGYINLSQRIILS